MLARNIAIGTGVTSFVVLIGSTIGFIVSRGKSLTHPLMISLLALMSLSAVLAAAAIYVAAMLPTPAATKVAIEKNKKIAQLTQEKEQAEGQVLNLHNQLQTEKQAFNEEAAKTIDWEGKHNDIYLENGDITQKLQTMKDENAKIVILNHVWEEDYRNLQNQNTNLQATLQQAEQNRIASVERVKAKMQEAHNLVQVQLMTLREERIKLHNELTEAKAQLEYQEESIRDLENALKAQDKMSSEPQAIPQETRDEIKINDLTTANEQLQQQLVDQQQANEQLQQELEAMQENLTEKETELTQAQEALTQPVHAGSALTNLEVHNMDEDKHLSLIPDDERNETLKEENDNLKEKNGEIKRNIEEKDKQIEQLSEEITTLNNEGEGYKKENAELREKVERLNKSLLQMGSKLEKAQEHAESSAEETRKVEKARDELEKQLQEKEEKLSALQTELNDQKTDIEEITEKLNQKSDENIELQDQLKTLQEKCEELQKQSNTADKDRDELLIKRESTQQELQTANQQIEVLEEQSKSQISDSIEKQKEINAILEEIMGVAGISFTNDSFLSEFLNSMEGTYAENIREKETLNELFSTNINALKMIRKHMHICSKRNELESVDGISEVAKKILSTSQGNIYCLTYDDKQPSDQKSKKITRSQSSPNLSNVDGGPSETTLEQVQAKSLDPRQKIKK